MQQYALKGYSVNAYDFIIKPVNYYAIETLMKKAAIHIVARHTDFVTVRTSGSGKSCLYPLFII